jgi:hypothetical protein
LGAESESVDRFLIFSIFQPFWPFLAKMAEFLGTLKTD